MDRDLTLANWDELNILFPALDEDIYMTRLTN